MGELSQGWYLEQNEERLPVSFPLELSYGDTGNYRLVRQMDGTESDINLPTLLLNSNHMGFDVFLDGERLYQYPSSTTLVFSKTTGNTFHFIYLPLDYAGKELTLDLHLMLGNSMTYTLVAPKIGLKSSILYQTAIFNLPMMTISFCIFLAGIAFLVLYFFLQKKIFLPKYFPVYWDVRHLVWGLCLL